ncbi:MAG: hypothetical protein WKF92_07600 [Pyrinomonadaceae bacterium]
MSKQIKKVPIVHFVCPNCKSSSLGCSDISFDKQQITCSDCTRQFSALVVKVRSRNSRHITKDDVRFLSIRVLDADGNEDLIEFDNPSKENFEFRAGDVVGFTYDSNGRLAILNNYTVDRTMFIKSGWNLNAIVGLGCLLLIVFAALLCLFGLASSK